MMHEQLFIPVGPSTDAHEIHHFLKWHDLLSVTRVISRAILSKRSTILSLVFQNTL